ncbi:uncharacterized protein LOC101237445 isoform X1 [Hydra vulgaris]|uniref:uncharacterized protein LOC101237445 isoform X1 n=1 Tax=Hydra vulgaris TaxID=6087 RepID=UPI001F5F8400|nr:uncharacterized protein LOC101237445 [Hydra vulgaris]
MAEILDEFDSESPAPKRFCSRMNKEQFEKQASKNTELALKELVAYLEYNPAAFYNICRKRQQEELESNSIYAFLKSKFWSWLSSESYEEEINLADAKKKLTEFKENAIKAFNYSEDAKGLIRRSSRLKNKKNQVTASDEKNSHKNFTNILESDRLLTSLIQNPIKINNINTNDNICRNTISPTKQLLSQPPPPPQAPPLPSFQKITNCVHQCKNQLHKTAMFNNYNENTKDFNSKNMYSSVLQSIVNGREKLKPISNRSFESTPRQLRKDIKKNPKDRGEFSLFNEILIDKFKQARGSPLIESTLSETGFTP